MHKKLLSHVNSICPVCGKLLDARYVEEDGKVYMEKTCPDHGSFNDIISNSAEDYTEWISHTVVNVPPRKFQKPGTGMPGSCPMNCGLCEDHMQTACCVLIDVTERCNQHCPYCFARSGDGSSEGCGYEPSLEELDKKFDLLLELGEEERPFNIQISGGEPTVRDSAPLVLQIWRI